MHTTGAKVVLLVVMILLIVGIDVAFLRGSEHTALRLVANVGIVAACGGIYHRFMR